MKLRKTTPLMTATLAAGLVAAFAVTSVANGNGFFVSGGESGAKMECPRGIVRLGQVFDETASVFPGDPSPHISLAATIEEDGFKVEEVQTGTHTGTHLDAPGHFIIGGRTVDQLTAAELVWPVYVVDVRQRMAASADDGFQLSVDDVRAYEKKNGRIPDRAMVVIRTGFDVLYRTPAYLGDAPGFSGAAVQWMVDQRNIGGVGSDTFGPDATSDADFSATYTILNNNRVALPGLNNLQALQVKGDIIMAPAVALRNGSGYQTDPLGCLGRLTSDSNGSGNGKDDDRKKND